MSATDPADGLASFSSFGQAAFLAAPGVAIQTTWPGDSYAVVGGTSMSAAVVAGVAGFMRAVDPGLSNGVIVGRMARTADPAGTREQTGNGRINMARALADTGTEPVQPAGADPVGYGGPFVGPYVAAAVNISTYAALGTNSCDTTATKTSFTLGNLVCARATGLGSDTYQIKWYSPSSAPKETSATNASGNLQDTYTPDSSGTWTVKAVRVSDGFISATAPFAVSAADTTPPVTTPTVTGTAGANGWYTSDVTVSWNVSDPESGMWNAVKGGSTVPLKFEVFAGTTELTSTSIVSALTKQVTCNAGAEDTVDVVATGGTSLRYDETTGQFIYNWQSPRLPGKCYSVTLVTLDGSSITALFKLK